MGSILGSPDFDYEISHCVEEQVLGSALAENDVVYGLNLGWGGPMGDEKGTGGDLLRDILQI